MTFRFVLQNKNAILLTVLEIERTIYIDLRMHSSINFLSDILRRQDKVDASTGNCALRHIGLLGSAQFLRDRSTADVHG